MMDFVFVACTILFFGLGIAAATKRRVQDQRAVRDGNFPGELFGG
jgi:hypothetical protein